MRGAAPIQIVGTLVFALLVTAAMRLAPVVLPQLCQTVLVASSDEKYGMLRDLAAGYNAAGRVFDGRCIRVSVEKVNSGDAEGYLESGWANAPVPRPDAWSPASSSWIVLLKQRSAAQATQVSPAAFSLFQSPLV